jgi:hypothetical protein
VKKKKAPKKIPKKKLVKKVSPKKIVKKKIIVPHYVCSGGCGQVSLELINCSTHGCIRHRNPLTLCPCTDGKHTDVSTLNVPKD